MSSILEDADDLRKAIGDMLEFGGHDVILAESGKKAVQLCQQKSFDLVNGFSKVPTAPNSFVTLKN